MSNDVLLALKHINGTGIAVWKVEIYNGVDVIYSHIQGDGITYPLVTLAANQSYALKIPFDNDIPLTKVVLYTTSNYYNDNDFQPIINIVDLITSQVYNSHSPTSHALMSGQYVITYDVNNADLAYVIVPPPPPPPPEVIYMRNLRIVNNSVVPLILGSLVFMTVDGKSVYDLSRTIAPNATYLIDMNSVDYTETAYDSFYLTSATLNTDVKVKVELVNGGLVKVITPETTDVLTLLADEEWSGVAEHKINFAVSNVDIDALDATYVQSPVEIAADKLATGILVDTLISGAFITDDQAVLLALGNSVMATAAMQVVNSGGGYNGLRTLGLTAAQAIKVLSIYNIQIEVDKYLSEVAIQRLLDDPTLMSGLITFLDGLSLQLPSLLSYAGTLRANHDVYTAMKDWTA